jgi:hypothetical protein
MFHMEGGSARARLGAHVMFHMEGVHIYVLT